MKNEDRIERAIIAGAAAALKYKAKHPNAYDEEILRELMKSLSETKSNID